jgi:hypothetical protein
VAGISAAMTRGREAPCTLNTLWQQPCARARATAQQGAVGKRTAKHIGCDVEAACRSAHRCGLHAVMLVLRAVKERGT